MGEPRSPEARCPFTRRKCVGVDCSLCGNFPKWYSPAEWVCTFCTHSEWDSWHTGVRPESCLPGAYSSGKCSRCGRDRILLMAVLPWSLEVEEDQEEDEEGGGPLGD